MSDLKQTLVPITLFVFVALVIIIAMGLLYQYWQKKASLKAVKHIVHDNPHVSPALIEAIMAEKVDKNSDLKKALFCFALSVATGLMAWTLGSSGFQLAQVSLFGMAFFPLLLALTYFIFHHIEKAKRH